ncbi:MAG: protein translocase subunit SecF [Candidatus Paceibacterota bacterium]
MNIIAHKNLYIAIGTGTILTSVAVLGILGLNLGIDFTGGALTEVAYEERPAQSELEAQLNTLALGGYSLRETVDDAGRDGYLLRTRDLSEAERQQVSAVVAGGDMGGEVTRFTSIGPVIGEELKDKAIWAIGAVVVIIVLYVAFAFRGVRKPVGSFVYGGITIVALLHDVLVPAALMGVLGYLLGVEVDVLFVMAILAVLGYSVNDTIVVFDRVRENLVKYRTEHTVKDKDSDGMPIERIEYTFTKPFDEVVNESVNDTLLRSINTSATTALAVAALYIFGGEVTQMFALMLLVGIFAGAYSSIFFASPLLVAFEEWKRKRSA